MKGSTALTNLHMFVALHIRVFDCTQLFVYAERRAHKETTSKFKYTRCADDKVSRNM